MDLDQAIELLKKCVKYPGTIDQKHIDLSVAPSDKRELFERALAVSQISISDGKITREEFMRRVHLT